LSRIVRIAALGFGILGGFLGSQGPEFSQQYRQRLGGAIDELRTVVSRFETDAQANAETRETAIRRLRSNLDDLPNRQGVAMQANVERLDRLQQHRHAMVESGPFGRVALMLREGDLDLMQATYRDFEPAVPVTEEGVVAGASGFAVAWGLVLLLMTFVRTTLHRSRRRTVRA
jgi:hypothetical protein